MKYGMGGKPLKDAGGHDEKCARAVSKAQGGREVRSTLSNRMTNRGTHESGPGKVRSKSYPV